ncbi:MAG: TIGR04283 family arsenosugar biosynthesis glycosyltransferase [Planctomycetaceae bacterium]|nr:TIGR04283 family arsenosugar biosynthesis glycosyltransferase [Planctomycetaceae bacterium]
MTCPLSIIIPIGPHETAWRNLLPQLLDAGGEAEILLASPDSEPDDWSEMLEQWGGEPPNIPVHWIQTPPGRALQMNEAARQANGEFLWFLHADSEINSETVEWLQNSLTAAPEALHYFDLKFQNDGPLLMRLNRWGVWIRSHWFQMPFGDQGLAISAKTFRELGGYDESQPYGEDHHFVWRARIAGGKLRRVGASIATSARKYRDRGWLRTTCRHVWLTWRQALPMWCQLWKRRWFG